MKSPLASVPVTLVTTGGTISTMVDNASGTTRPTLDGDAIARLTPASDPSAVIELAHVPSWALSPRDMQRIALRLRDEARNEPSGALVVTVGTSTLEYVAYLTDLFVDTNVPVIFTGAMRKADDPLPDGPRNLADAFAVARSPQSRGRGALVCFHGHIMPARAVWKRHRSDPEAFVSVEGDVGQVVAGDVTFSRAPAVRHPLAGEIEPAVALLKAYPGCDGSAVSDSMARGIRGLVIEALPGAGGVPPAMQDALRTAAADGVLVAIASRAPYGSVPRPPTGGTGSPLAGADYLSAGTLTAEKAWVLLMAVLGQAPDRWSAAALFEEIACVEASA